MEAERNRRPSRAKLLPAGAWLMKAGKNPPVNAGDECSSAQSLGWEDSLEKEMATHSNIPVWEIPWAEEPGG